MRGVRGYKKFCSLLVFTALVGCFSQPQRYEFVTLQGQKYRIPVASENVVDTQNVPPRYVRLCPLPDSMDGLDFCLSVDDGDRKYNLENNNPELLGVIGDKLEDYVKYTYEVYLDKQKIVCRKQAIDFGRDCGFRLQDGSVSWSVSFARAHSASYVQMREKATLMLNEYREHANVE
jgi:hypothetical protein